jgi:hypothetical protein
MTKLGTKHAAWSTTSGTHELTVRQAVTHLPKAKPEVTTAQVHNGEDDVLAVRLRGKRLFVEHDGENLGDLTTSYRLGTPYTVRIVAAKGRIKIFYNGVQKVDHRAKAKNCYFKTGAYTQTNTSKGDAADAYGEVAIYDLKVKHA